MTVETTGFKNRTDMDSLKISSLLRGGIFEDRRYTPCKRTEDVSCTFVHGKKMYSYDFSCKITPYNMVPFMCEVFSSTQHEWLKSTKTLLFILI